MPDPTQDQEGLLWTHGADGENPDHVCNHVDGDPRGADRSQKTVEHDDADADPDGLRRRGERAASDRTSTNVVEAQARDDHFGEDAGERRACRTASLT